MRARLSLLATMSVLAAALVAPGAASAQNQQGLVNVSITDTTIQIPIGVAANVCGTTVALLSQQIETGTVDCTAVAEADAFSMGGGAGGPANQQGLVNIAIDDTDIQVPVGVAVNICGTGVFVLAQDVNTGDTTCEARGRGNAQA